MNKICFREEAKDWNEALPIGNGFLGAMVFGKIGTERLQINEDSVWTGSFMERVNPDARENYPKVRELLLNGEIEQAELLAERSPPRSPSKVVNSYWSNGSTDILCL